VNAKVGAGLGRCPAQSGLTDTDAHPEEELIHLAPAPLRFGELVSQVLDFGACGPELFVASGYCRGREFGLGLRRPGDFGQAGEGLERHLSAFSLGYPLLGSR